MMTIGAAIRYTATGQAVQAAQDANESAEAAAASAAAAAERAYGLSVSGTALVFTPATEEG